MNINEQLAEVQSKLKAPKNQRNNFGNYNYRSAEDILEAVKPLLHGQGLTLTIDDEIVEVGGRVYVKATATVTNNEAQRASATAYAREPEDKKGMDLAQLTGATSSYARKYALNGLFAIDDTKDADATNTHDSKRIYESPTANDRTPPATPKQKKLIFDLLNQLDIPKSKQADYLHKEYEVLEGVEIKIDEARRIISHLQHKVQK